MSGGSFNYLYRAEGLVALITSKRDDLQEMADALDCFDYAADAAIETRELLAHLDAADASRARLAGVWKAVEWYRSCDWDDDKVRKALAEYRGETPDTPDTFGALTAGLTDDQARKVREYAEQLAAQYRIETNRTP